MDEAMQQTILFFVQILSLAFLIIYVVKTWEMASATRKAAEATEKSVFEMRETRDQETAPFIVVYFDIPIGSGLIYLVVKNIGRTVATQVKLTFTPPLCTSDNNPPLAEMNFIKKGIGAMPPNYEIRTLFDSSAAYFGNDELPLEYSVNISYYGGIESKQRVIEQPLDLSANKGILYIRHKNMDNLVSEVERLVRESREIRSAANNIASSLEQGIFITNASLAITKLEPDMKNWKKSLWAKLNEFENIWTISYRDERERGVGQNRLQQQAIIIGRQILTLMANKIDNIPTDTLESVALISNKLHKLGRLRFYMDGGASLIAFNELGDSIITDIINFKTKSA